MTTNGGRVAREFHVETDFQKSAARPGGPSRDQAIQNAGEAIEKIKPSVIHTLDSEVRQIVALLERNGDLAHDPARLASIRSAYERVIDVADTLGYTLASVAAFSLRTVCEAVDAGIAVDREILSCHAKILLLSLQPRYRTVPITDLPELNNGLARLRGLLKSS